MFRSPPFLHVARSIAQTDPRWGIAYFSPTLLPIQDPIHNALRPEKNKGREKRKRQTEKDTNINRGVDRSEKSDVQQQYGSTYLLLPRHPPPPLSLDGLCTLLVARVVGFVSFRRAQARMQAKDFEVSTGGNVRQERTQL